MAVGDARHFCGIFQLAFELALFAQKERMKACRKSALTGENVYSLCCHEKCKCLTSETRYKQKEEWKMEEWEGKSKGEILRWPHFQGLTLRKSARSARREFNGSTKPFFSGRLSRSWDLFALVFPSSNALRSFIFGGHTAQNRGWLENHGKRMMMGAGACSGEKKGVKRKGVRSIDGECSCLHNKIHPRPSPRKSA